MKELQSGVCHREFHAGYNRVGTIEVLSGYCDVCHAETHVIAIDPSEGEYGPGAICRDCIAALFTEIGA